MRYPEPLKKGDVIGICAPSMGVRGVWEKRLDNAIGQLGQLGYPCLEAPSVRNAEKLTSADAKQRAETFMSLYFDKAVKAIIPPWGGELLMDMLPYLDYERISKEQPKWVMGFSDTSTLMFALTLKGDMATVHGPNMLDFGCTPIDPSVLASLECLGSTEKFEQNSLESYQENWGNVSENFAVPYQLTGKVEWKRLGGGGECAFQGRLLGGCLDVLCKLIGTPYAPVMNFIEKYRKDRIIWFFESCEMNASDIYKTLWQMKMNGWFENCSGVLIGRPDGYEDVRDFDLIDALFYPLGELNIPILYDTDIGHIPPQLTLVNGAYAEVRYNGGIGKAIQKWIR